MFKVSKSGKETVLHSFAGGTTDGQYPAHTTLLMDKQGNLYGVTEQGGTSSQGVVYKLSKSGTWAVLHSFAGGTTDGCYASGTPIMDKNSNLYGTTQLCGSSNGGIVWKLRQTGRETVLHSFTGGTTDGQYPLAGVIMDAKGNLYGDTTVGGASGVGTVYELNKKATLTLLHSFAGPEGSYPDGGLVRDAKGKLYGTASDGGNSGVGTVWRLTP